MISDFLNNAFEAAEFLVYCWPNSCFMFVTKEKLFFNLWFLLLLTERMLSPESCLSICHSRASCCKKVSVYIYLGFFILVILTTHYQFSFWEEIILL